MVSLATGATHSKVCGKHTLIISRGISPFDDACGGSARVFFHAEPADGYVFFCFPSPVIAASGSAV